MGKKSSVERHAWPWCFTVASNDDLKDTGKREGRSLLHGSLSGRSFSALGRCLVALAGWLRLCANVRLPSLRMFSFVCVALTAISSFTEGVVHHFTSHALVPHVRGHASGRFAWFVGWMICLCVCVQFVGLLNCWMNCPHATSILTV